MANLVIGLYNPFKHAIREHEGYDITKFKDYIRFMEIIEDRDYGAGGQVCPLFFNGATSYFHELPLADDTQQLNEVYNYIRTLNSQRTNKLFFGWLNKLKRKIKIK